MGGPKSCQYVHLTPACTCSDLQAVARQPVGVDWVLAYDFWQYAGGVYAGAMCKPGERPNHSLVGGHSKVAAWWAGWKGVGGPRLAMPWVQTECVMGIAHQLCAAHVGCCRQMVHSSHFVESMMHSSCWYGPVLAQ